MKFIMKYAVKKPYQLGVQDIVTSRVYQAFEKLQMAWYTVNMRRPTDAPLDEVSITEIKAVEEEWLAAYAKVCAIS